MSEAVSIRTTPAEATGLGRSAAAGAADPHAVGTNGTAQPAILSYTDFRIRPHNCFACGELNEVGLHLQLNLEPERC